MITNMAATLTFKAIIRLEIWSYLCCGLRLFWPSWPPPAVYSTVHVCLYYIIYECPQWYCGEIRQILIFRINLYYLKVYHRLDHSIHIVEYQKKIPKIVFTETRTQDTFRVCDISSCHIFVETINYVLCAVLRSYLVFKLQKPSPLGLESRTVFRGCGLFL
jgi:cystathionine beta-lyase/cystathionine gamma-synthase